MLYMPDLMPEEAVRYDTAERIRDVRRSLIEQQARLHLELDEAAYTAHERLLKLRADEAQRLAEIRYQAQSK